MWVQSAGPSSATYESVAALLISHLKSFQKPILEKSLVVICRFVGQSNSIQRNIVCAG